MIEVRDREVRVEFGGNLGDTIHNSRQEEEISIPF